MAESNNIQNAVKALLEGVDGVLTSKTVVGAPVTVGDTILIPLNDVTIGLGAGANNADKKNSGAGGFSAKLSPSAVLVIKGGNTKVVSIKDQNSLSRLIDMVPEVVDKIVAARQGKEMMDDDEAAQTAFPGADEGSENT